MENMRKKLSGIQDLLIDYATGFSEINGCRGYFFHESIMPDELLEKKITEVEIDYSPENVV